jgi:CRP-like cAMP-binding protein
MFGLRNPHQTSAAVRLALGSRYNDADLALLDRFGTIVNLQAGAALTVEGQTGREAMWILDGTAIVSRDDEIIAELGAGDLVGERSVLTGEPRNATVMTTSGVTALVFSSAEFRSLVQQNGQLAADIDKLIASRN